MSKKILFSLDRGLPGDTKYGASLSLTINDEYVISGQLLDQNGDPLGEEQTLDLPLESMVVDGSYDSENKALILTLDNGNTISIPIADLINGLQAEITPENKLSADLVDDSSTENKFVTQEEKDEIARSANLNLENGEGNGSIKLEGNTVSGQKGVGFGHNNTVQADRAFATGGGNIIRYDGQTKNGYMGFASGQNNYVSGRSASAIGEQLQAKYGGQLVVGKANLNKPDTLFEVGNGETSFINVSSKPSWQDIISNPIYYISNGSDGFTKITENNITEAQYDNLLISEIYVFYDGGRSNAFEVTETGVARAYGTPVRNNDLIPKGFADIYYAQSVKTITVALSQIAGAGDDAYTTAQYIRFAPTAQQAAILMDESIQIIKLDLTALGASAPAPYVWLRRNTVVELPNPLDPTSTIPAYQFTCGGEQFWYENYQTDITIKNIGNAALVYVEQLILDPALTPHGVADITLLNVSIPDLYKNIGNKLDKVSFPNKIYGTDSSGEQATYDLTSFSRDLNLENGIINGTLTQKSLSYDQMITDFEPNMVAYVSYIGAGVSSPTSEQLIALLNSDKTNPYVAGILGNYTFDQYCQGFLAGTGSVQPGVSNKTAVDALVVQQLSDRWGVSSSDDLSNFFGAASDGAVGLGFKNKLYSPAAITLGFDNEAGDEGYPSESIGAFAGGFFTQAKGNQGFTYGKGDKEKNRPLVNNGNQSLVFGDVVVNSKNGFSDGTDKDSFQMFKNALSNAGVITSAQASDDSYEFAFDGNHSSASNFCKDGYIDSTSGSWNVNFGKNAIIGQDNLIQGWLNVIKGMDSNILGTANTIIGAHNDTIIGWRNEIKSENWLAAHNFITGFGNSLEECAATFVSGGGNSVKNTYGDALLGHNLKSIHSSYADSIPHARLGRYNTDGADNIFEIGNGTAENGRSNAFEITDTGIARAYGTPSGDYDLTPKSYVDALKPLSGAGAPTSSTVANYLGQTYIDTTNKIPYMCVGIDNGTYTWVAIAAVSLDYSSTN